MFAILISEETLPEITERYGYPPELEFNYTMFIKSNSDWYMIGGYVPERGGYVDWAIQPAYLFEKHFDYDPVKIKTDWDQVFRKQ